MLEFKIDKEKLKIPSCGNRNSYEEYEKLFDSLEEGQSFIIPKNKSSNFRTAFRKITKYTHLKLVQRACSEGFRCWIIKR